MKTFKRKLAVFLTILLMMPTIPAAAVENSAEGYPKLLEELPVESVSANVISAAETEEMLTLKGNAADKVVFNTGKQERSVVDAGVSANVAGDDYFGEDGSYTINIPEDNPFFPYEVQFKCDGKVTNEWFMTPDDSVEIGGHTFYVSANFDNTVVTQMSLNVAGDTVIVYPEEKEFTNDSVPAVQSLLPLKERRLNVDLSGYTPVELTMVSVDSIFIGENALEDKSKVVWTYRDNKGDYTISESGDRINLSYNTSSFSSTSLKTSYWEMIVGDSDQLAADNIRYLIDLKITGSYYWLMPTVYSQDENGNRNNISTAHKGYYYDNYSNKEIRYVYCDVLSEKWDYTAKTYVGLDINSSVFANPRYDHLKMYEGRFDIAGDAMTGTDITNQIFSTDLTQKDAGYEIISGTDNWVTMVAFDSENTVIGCLPFKLSLSVRASSVGINSLFQKTANGRTYVRDTSSSYYRDNCYYQTITLYRGYAANASYCLTMYYYDEGYGSSDSNAKVTAAYKGQFSSIAEAVASGETDIKELLFGNNYTGGYEADYSQGVYFTVFVGEDGTENQEVYHCCITTKEGERENLSSGTNVWFSGLKDSAEKDIKSYVTKNDDDSYGEQNYITILVDENVDLSNLAPVFSLSDGAKLYAAGSNTPEISGKSLHDFSKGPVQYTVSAENSVDSKSYWLQVIKAVTGKGKLYINSLEDANAHTREEDGVIYSTREVMLDGYHDYVHDILLTNIGTEAIPKLSAQLDSDVVVLDDYWTLNGTYDLAGFNTMDRTASYGELPNLAKIRIKAKDSTAKGIDVSGTLTIKSGTETLLVLTLTGIVGDPAITTKEIPQAVKYVPYGTMIQNNNKYSWNKVSYRLMNGTLPTGMEIRPNGEIYGVPSETGEFTFTVRMTNSSGSFSYSEMTYTLVVVENTDVNVDAATDTGYELTQRVQNPNMVNGGSQTLVSQGEYAQFEDIYLDGVKLVEGKDYTSESGSTRITIQNQTLSSAAAGTHTLGIEFRTQDTGTLKCAAQNYNNNSGSGNNGDNDNKDPGNNSGNNNSGTGGNNAGSGESGNSGNGTAVTENNGSRNIGASSADGTTTTISYTIQSGDTLWKIAEKYYGSGQYWKKIFEDNKDVISDPDKIYVGQVIVIILEQGDGSETIEGTSYTVQYGDTLYKIAKEFYGKGWKWRKIYSANKNMITAPEHIYAGQVIIIPEG